MKLAIHRRGNLHHTLHYISPWHLSPPAIIHTCLYSVSLPHWNESFMRERTFLLYITRAKTQNSHGNIPTQQVVAKKINASRKKVGKMWGKNSLYLRPAGGSINCYYFFQMQVDNNIY